VPKIDQTAKTSINDLNEWKEEIRNILRGKREGLLVKYGSVGGYLRKIAENKNSAFDDALQEVVSSWEVHIPREREYFAVMLEFIRAYTPGAGYKKVKDFLEFWENRIHELQDKFGYDSKANLIINAIETLSAYYPNPNEISINKYYESLLEKYLYEPSVSGQIAVNLFKSNILDIDDKKIREVINKTPECLINIISYVFSPKIDYELGDNLAKLASIVFEVGDEAISIFEKRLNLFNTTITYRPTTQNDQPELYINLPNSEGIAVKLSENSLDNFITAKNDIHLLPAFLNKVQRRGDEYHKKIQDVFSKCQRDGVRLVRLFSKKLYRLGITFYPESYQTTSGWVRIYVRLENGSEIPLICRIEYLEDGMFSPQEADVLAVI